MMMFEKDTFYLKCPRMIRFLFCKGRFVLSYSLEVQSIVIEKSSEQELEAADHFVSVVREQRLES